jgi:hypothetical protein
MKALINETVTISPAALMLFAIGFAAFGAIIGMGFLSHP